MLLVDDAHLLDSASATVVHQLATTTDTFVVVTVRTGEPCPDPVEALWKDEVAARLDLEPLDREDTERLVGELLDGIVEAATARTIWDRSAGNPLFVRELVTAAMETDLLQSVDGIWRLVAQLRPSPRLDELVGSPAGGTLRRGAGRLRAGRGGRAPRPAAAARHDRRRDGGRARTTRA